MKPAQIFGVRLFPPIGGSRFNTKLTVLQHMAKCREHTELKQFYADLSERGFRDSDEVVNYFKALNPKSISKEDARLLNQAVFIPMENGLVVHMDIAGEAALKHGEIREYLSSDEPSTIPFTSSSQRPAWFNNDTSSEDSPASIKFPAAAGTTGRRAEAA